MNYLNKFDFKIIIFLLTFGFIFEYYHKDTISNIIEINNKKINAQYTITVTPIYESDIITYQKILKTKFSLFFTLFMDNLGNFNELGEYFSTKSNKVDSDLYFHLDRDYNNIFITVYSNHSNKLNSFHLAKKIKKYINNYIVNEIINEVQQLNKFANEDGGLAKLVYNDMYYEILYFDKILKNISLKVSEINKINNNNNNNNKISSIEPYIPYNLFFFIFLVILFIMLKKMNNYE